MAAVVSATEAPFADVHLRGGRRVILRPVHPADKEAVHVAVKRLSAESRYSRFMSPLRELSPEMLERAVNPERGRELQIVAVIDGWQGAGLARLLLETLMREARARGFERMEGYILASNTRMPDLAKRLGFAQVESTEGPTVRLVRHDLRHLA